MLINCSLYIFDVFKTLECQLGVIKVSELIGLTILILKVIKSRIEPMEQFLG